MKRNKSVLNTNLRSPETESGSVFILFTYLGTKNTSFSGPTRIFNVGEKISLLLLLAYSDSGKVSPHVDKSTSEEVTGRAIIREQVRFVEKILVTESIKLLNSVFKAHIFETRKRCGANGTGSKYIMT